MTSDESRLEQIAQETGLNPDEVRDTQLDDYNITGLQKSREGLYQRIKRKSTDYLVDVSAGWIFFTPIYTAMEHYIAGMDSGEVFKSRSAGLVAHAIAMRPTGMLRNALANKWNVTKESPWYKKVAVNVCAGTPIQAMMYSGMLAYSGASMDEIAVALPTGLAMAIPLFEPFGRWMDTWRKIWKKKPAIG